MPSVPYPLTARTIEELQTKIYHVLRDLYENKIGGADLGDVFSIYGDVFTLVLADASGLTKAGNELALDVDTDGGLQLTTDGLGVKLDGDTLELSTSGLKVANTAIVARDASVVLTASDMNRLHIFDTTGGDLIATLPETSTLEEMDWVSCARIGTNKLSVVTSGADAIAQAGADTIDNKDSTSPAKEYSVITVEFAETGMYHIGKRNFGIWNLR